MGEYGLFFWYMISEKDTYRRQSPVVCHFLVALVWLPPFLLVRISEG